MATIGNTNLTWLDYAKRLDPGGKVDRIVEMLEKTNEIMDDMVVVAGNTQTGHKSTIRTGLPTVAWRQINKGVQPSKSTTKQIEFPAGMLEGMGKVDEELVALAEDKAGFRLSENAPYIEAISQTLASTLFYGDVTVNPERFTGLSKYYSALSGADSSANVISGLGDTADKQTSLWLVVWGENTIHAFFPKATKAGIEHNDLGKMLTSDGASGEYMAFVDQYKAKLGLAVRDWRYAVRIPNIDTVKLLTAGSGSDTSADLVNLMIKAVNKIPNIKAGKAAWYCNAAVKTALDIKALNKSNVQLSVETLANGSPVTKFLGIPVRRCDAILSTEAVMT